MASEEQQQKYHINDIKSAQIWPKLLIGCKASVTLKSFPKAVFKRKRGRKNKQKFIVNAEQSMVRLKVNKKLCLVIKKQNPVYPWKNNNTGFRKCSRLAYYTCVPGNCLNHQSEALPRFYVISVEFSLINLGQSQLWVCHTNQNSLNTANSRTSFIC